jgi:hypothetical protein
MPKRLELVSDSDRLFPVQAFFNSISSQNFVETIQRLLNGIDMSIDDTSCDFAGNLATDDEHFEGVRFSLYEDSVIIGEGTFNRFLTEACKAHLRQHPEDQAALEKALSERGWTTRL